jgi:hypothetical protein
MKQKPFWKMNARELAKATKQFDREIPANAVRSLAPEERERWERLRKAPSRSVYVLDDGPRRRRAVLLELDSELLREVDARAGVGRLTRSKWVERQLRSALGLSKTRNGARKHRRPA